MEKILVLPQELPCPRPQFVAANCVKLAGLAPTSSGSQVRAATILISLVCNKDYAGGLRCPNPAKGQAGGDTWEKREALIRGITLPGDVGREQLAA